MKRKHVMIENEAGGEGRPLHPLHHPDQPTDWLASSSSSSSVESELTRFRREWEHELSQNALYNDLLLAEAIRASLADAQSFHPTPVRRQRLDPWQA